MCVQVFSVVHPSLFLRWALCEFAAFGAPCRQVTTTYEHMPPFQDVSFVPSYQDVSFVPALLASRTESSDRHGTRTTKTMEIGSVMSGRYSSTSGNSRRSQASRPKQTYGAVVHQRPPASWQLACPYTLPPSSPSLIPGPCPATPSAVPDASQSYIDFVPAPSVSDGLRYDRIESTRDPGRRPSTLSRPGVGSCSSASTIRPDDSAPRDSRGTSRITLSTSLLPSSRTHGSSPPEAPLIITEPGPSRRREPTCTVSDGASLARSKACTPPGSRHDSAVPCPVEPPVPSSDRTPDSHSRALHRPDTSRRLSLTMSNDSDHARRIRRAETHDILTADVGPESRTSSGTPHRPKVVAVTPYAESVTSSQASTRPSHGGGREGQSRPSRTGGTRRPTEETLPSPSGESPGWCSPRSGLDARRSSREPGDRDSYPSSSAESRMSQKTEAAERHIRRRSRGYG